MTERITKKRVMDVMCQVVGEFGVDYVYTKIGDFCHNWLDGCPSCLIGHVMHRLGASGEFLASHSREAAYTLMFFYTKETGVDFEEGVYGILSEAQQWQDSGHPWGYALRKALEKHDQLRAQS